MATKINPDFYGAENSFIALPSGNVKTAPHNLNWYGNNSVYMGGDWDTTAAPWGIGRSSLSSNMIQVPTIGQEWTVNQHENTKGNNPLYMYHNINNCYGSFGLGDFTGASATWQNYARTLFKCRYSPDAHTNENSVISDLPVDDGEYITIADCYDNYPITYADYSKLRLAIRNIQYKPTNSDVMKRVDGLPALLNANDVDKITKITFDIYNPDRSQCGFYTSIGGVSLSMPDIFKTRYYDDVDEYVRPWRYNADIGHWAGSSSTEFVRVTSTDHFSYTSTWETLSSSDDVIAAYPTIVGYAMANISKTAQVFDDVSYHWEYGICPFMGAGHNFDITPIQTGDEYESGIVQTFAYMELDDYSDNLTKTQAYVRAILHEVAFMGFAIIGDIFDSAENIGSNKVYLPVFNEHMITTGEYKQGMESLTLPNATWGDVFGADMPDYDPTYDPDEPPEPDNDFGDLYNTGHMQYRFDTKLNIWCFYNGGQHAGIDTVINAINNLYLNDPDGNSKWQLDFKGSNPSDYIIGLYVTPLIVPHSTNVSTFTLGPVDFDGDINTYTYNGSGHFTFGSVNLYGDDYPLFGDFRDYAPYTQIELYIPLCGTITLDPAFFVGHSITIDMYYDILTMSCVAAIYRDGITLYKTINGSIGAQIPITSLDMGSYQNTIHALESAQKQNDMRLMTSILTMGASAAAAIATGGVSLGVGAAALTGAAGLYQTVEQGQQIDYNIDHTAPTVAQTGTAEAQNSFCVGSMYAKLFVKRAKLLSGHNDTVYSKTVGNACCINDYIGGTEDNPRSGLVVCSNINTNDITNSYGESPTVEEINAIKQAFSTGVYI